MILLDGQKNIPFFIVFSFGEDISDINVSVSAARSSTRGENYMPHADT